MRVPAPITNIVPRNTPASLRMHARSCVPKRISRQPCMACARPAVIESRHRARWLAGARKERAGWLFAFEASPCACFANGWTERYSLLLSLCLIARTRELCCYAFLQCVFFSVALGGVAQASRRAWNASAARSFGADPLTSSCSAEQNSRNYYADGRPVCESPPPLHLFLLFFFPASCSARRRTRVWNAVA